MKRFDLRLRFPTGSVLIGGYSPVPSGAHAIHALDSRGRPVIPATALRGALRESLEAILRGIGEKVCSGGDGLDPESAKEEEIPIPCTLDNGRLCQACRFFGSRRAKTEPNERAFSAIVIGDAVLAENRTIEIQLRPGVSISREQRSARDNRLYMQRIPSTPDTWFKAEGILLDASMEKLLLAAIRGTTHIGGGRSRGLARVEIEQPNWQKEPLHNAAVLTTNDIRIRVTLTSPASIGAPVVHPNLRETRKEIPGSALRGAIGFTLAAILDDPNQDTIFQTLVSEDGARFGFLHPVEAKDAKDAKSDNESGPLPITTSACKEHKNRHGLADTLFDQLAVALVQNAEEMESVARHIVSDCNQCGQPLRSYSGWRRRTNDVPTRLVTRVSLDRRMASARDEFLFSQTLLESGTMFEGTIQNVSSEGRDYLARALGAPLSLGRGRSAGWGRVSVEVLEPLVQKTALERGDAFERNFAERLKQAGVGTSIVGRLVAITLLSPLLLDGDSDGEKELSDHLGAARCVFKARRFSREGGWDQRDKGMQSAIAVSAGGVFVFELEQPWREALKSIGGLEREGLGLRRHQGYGRVLAFDPMFHEWKKGS